MSRGSITGFWQGGFRAPLIACAAAIALAGSVLAQTAPPISPDPARSPPPAAAPAAPAQPDVLESIRRWFEQGAANFGEHLRSAKERFDDLGEKAAATSKTLSDNAVEVGKNAAEATKTAVDAMTKLPTARVVQGREVCALAPNGAPDCQAAAERLCRGKGFTTGKSVDFTSAEKCPPKVWVSGRRGNEDQCTTETFISRAMCQ
jgi:hypothetical protein